MSQLKIEQEKTRRLIGALLIIAAIGGIAGLYGVVTQDCKYEENIKSLGD